MSLTARADTLFVDDDRIIILLRASTPLSCYPAEFDLGRGIRQLSEHDALCDICSNSWLLTHSDKTF
jgi:hypothetical protein